MTKFKVKVEITPYIANLDIVPTGNRNFVFWGSISAHTIVTIPTIGKKSPARYKCSVSWCSRDGMDSKSAEDFACGLAYAASVAKLSPDDFVKKLNYMKTNKIDTVEYSLK